MVAKRALVALPAPHKRPRFPSDNMAASSHANTAAMDAALSTFSGRIQALESEMATRVNLTDRIDGLEVDARQAVFHMAQMPQRSDFHAVQEWVSKAENELITVKIDVASTREAVEHVAGTVSSMKTDRRDESDPEQLQQFTREIG